MKIVQMVLLLSVCSIMLFTVGCKTIRGVELHIVDVETGAPISNVCVYYHLTKYKANYLFNSGENDIDQITIVDKKVFTDERGCVYLKRHIVFLGFLHGIDEECFYINISKENPEPDVDKFYYFSRYFVWNWDEGISFPTQEYYPAVIYNFYGDLDGYAIIQKTWNLKEKQKHTKSDLQEKEDIVITIGLKKIETEGPSIRQFDQQKFSGDMRR